MLRPVPGFIAAGCCLSLLMSLILLVPQIAFAGDNDSGGTTREKDRFWGTDPFMGFDTDPKTKRRKQKKRDLRHRQYHDDQYKPRPYQGSNNPSLTDSPKINRESLQQEDSTPPLDQHSADDHEGNLNNVANFDEPKNEATEDSNDDLGPMPAVFSWYLDDEFQGDEQILLNEKFDENGEGSAVPEIYVPRSILDEPSLKSTQRAALKSTVRSVSLDGDEYVCINDLRDVMPFQFDTDEFSLRLYSPSYKQPKDQRVNFRGVNRPKNIHYSKSTSLFTNYSLQLADLKQFSAYGEAGLSWRRHLLYSDITYQLNNRPARGQSNLTIDIPRRMTRIILGDSISSGGGLGSQVLQGGIKVERQYALDPYFLRYPSFSLRTPIVRPSTVDVMVNGNRVKSQQVEPGMYRLEDLPLSRGAGVSEIVIRDPFGNQRVLTQPFYYSTGVLKSGLHEYSYSSGFRREGFGLRSFDYGGLMGHAFHRLGVNPWLTIGAVLEGAAGVVSGGPLTTLRMPLGQIDFGGAVSTYRSQPGIAAMAGYSYLSQQFGIGGGIRFNSDRYANVQLTPSENRATIEGNAFLSVPFFNNGNASLQYAGSSFREGEIRNHVALRTNTQISQRIDLSLNAAYDRIDGRNVYEGFVLLSFFLGARMTANISHTQTNTQRQEQFTLRRPMGFGPDWGYQFNVENGVTNRIGLSTRAQTTFGRYGASFERLNGAYRSLLSASGGFVLMNKGLFATPSVTNGFALVDVPGVPNVRAYVNNLLIGKTNKSGRVLVPKLQSYYGNKISIDARDVPLSFRLDRTAVTVAPPFRGGSHVHFPAEQLLALTGYIRVQSTHGVVIPGYGDLDITIEGRTLSSPIGKDGLFYFEDVRHLGAVQAEVNYKGQVCRFSFAVRQREKDEDMIDVGELTCVNETFSP